MPTIVGSACAIVFLLTAAYSSVSVDVTAANVLSWQLVTTGDAEFTSDTYPPIDQHAGREIWVQRAPNGHDVIGRSPGAVAVALPAYLMIGGDRFSLVPGAVTAAMVMALACVLLALTLRPFMASRHAALAATIFGLGTPVWSVAADGIWPHTVTVLGICGMAWAAAKERWWAVGAFGGVVLWGRLHAAVIVAIVGVLLGWRRRDIGITTAIGTSSGLMLAIQCAWTRWIYGSWNPMTSYDTGPFEEYVGGHGINLVNHLGFWISPDRGLLVWSPLLLLLLPALVRSWRGLPDWSRALVLGGLAYTILQGTLNRFSGGDYFYGYRLTLELLACCAPALALSAPAMGRLARALFAPVLALQTMVISAGAVNGTLGSTAEEVWRRHSFFSDVAGRPALLIGLVSVGVAAGVLGQRIWADPGIRSFAQRS